jgi:citrate synthase
MLTPDRLLTASEAADLLGVKRETIYAYKSRGLLPSRATGRGGSATHGQFHPDDVEALRQGRRPPATPSTPVTALTLIEDGSVYYRGLPIEKLAREHTFEQVADWLLEGTLGDDSTWVAEPAAVSAARRTLASVPPGVLPLDKIRLAVCAAALEDPIRFETSPAAWVITARRLITTVIESLPVVGDAEGAGADNGSSLAARLWPRLTELPASPKGVELLNVALVLHADHEFGSSTVAARVAASVGADPYSVVLAGLSCYGAGSHSGDSLKVEELLASSSRYADPAVALGAVLRPYGRCPGFGSDVHPSGDPRATAMLDRLGEADEPRSRIALRLADAAAARGLASPNKDFGLGSLAHTYSMVPGASEAIFAISRIAGWLAHGLEARVAGTRPRARGQYIGAPPVRVRPGATP